MIMRERKIEFSPPDISEEEIKEVVAALQSGWITTGPRTKLLERRLAAYIDTGTADIDCKSNTDHYSNRVACLNSATAAEELALRVLGVEPGDEVIVPAYTYTATASAAIHCGANVVFVDIKKDGDPLTGMPEMDPERISAAINERTKAIVPVDLGGIIADYDAIFEIVNNERHRFQPSKPKETHGGELSARIQSALGRIAVVADSAHSLGASRVFRGEWKNSGAIADFASFSFHAVKNFTTAEGGAITWTPIEGVSNEEIYRMFQLLSLHGQSKDALAKTQIGAWEYDIIAPWFKCNMTDIMAAIGLRQLDRYPGLLKRRNEIVERYNVACDELGIQRLYHNIEVSKSSKHLYLMRIPGIGEETRNSFINEMAKRGVSTNVHYKPLPMMTAYKTMGWNIQDFPNSYDYYKNLVSLPLHTMLSDDDVSYVIEALQDTMRVIR